MIARILRLAAGLAIFQVADELGVGFSRSVDHEVDPGPGVAVFIAPHVLEVADSFQRLQARRGPLPEQGADSGQVRVFGSPLVLRDFEVFSNSFVWAMPCRPAASPVR